MNSFASSTILPLLSRVVLSLVFFTTGYSKLFMVKQYDVHIDVQREEAEDLLDMGVTLRPVAVIPPSQNDSGMLDAGSGRITLIAQEAQLPEVTLPPPKSDGPGEARYPFAFQYYEARVLYEDALLLSESGMEHPRLLAWIAVLIEFGSGIFLLPGICTRIWSMGLVVTMMSAFVVISLERNGLGHTSPLLFVRNTDAYLTAVAQLSLLTLSIGLLLTGPGPLSIDAVLRRGRARTGTPARSKTRGRKKGDRKKEHPGSDPG